MFVIKPISFEIFEYTHDLEGMKTRVLFFFSRINRMMQSRSLLREKKYGLRKKYVIEVCKVSGKGG